MGRDALGMQVQRASLISIVGQGVLPTIRTDHTPIHLISVLDGVLDLLLLPDNSLGLARCLERDGQPCPQAFDNIRPIGFFHFKAPTASTTPFTAHRMRTGSAAQGT